MCRNITALRGLEPVVTSEEVEDAARQFIRKVAGLRSTSHMARDDVQRAIEVIARTTHELLVNLPAPRTAPEGPPGRRRIVGSKEV